MAYIGKKKDNVGPLIILKYKQFFAIPKNQVKTKKNRKLQYCNY